MELFMLNLRAYSNLFAGIHWLTLELEYRHKARTHYAEDGVGIQIFKTLDVRVRIRKTKFCRV